MSHSQTFDLEVDDDGNVTYDGEVVAKIEDDTTHDDLRDQIKTGVTAIFDKRDAEDDNEKSDDVEISDANSGPIDREDIMDMLKNDPEIMDKIGTGDDDDLYWDGMDLVSSKFDDDTIASIPDNANMTLGDLKKQIMDYEEDMDETKTINGVKYKPIKESKQHILKENYERFFGDKK